MLMSDRGVGELYLTLDIAPLIEGQLQTYRIDKIAELYFGKMLQSTSLFMPQKICPRDIYCRLL